MKTIAEMTDEELSVAIAIEVMGWSQVTDDWLPATDVASAFQVVGKLQEGEFSVSFALGAPHPIFSSPQSQLWKARFSGDVVAYAKTPARAVCEAALAMVRKQI